MITENCFEINRYELKISINGEHSNSIVSNDIDEINTSYARIFNRLHNYNGNEVKGVVHISIFDYDKNTVIKEYGTDEI